MKLFYKSGLIMKVLQALLFSLFLVQAAHASPDETVRHGCYHEHISSSIAINRAREETYLGLNRKDAAEVLEHLIFLERLALLTTPYYDWKAENYQNHGIPLFCEEFKALQKNLPKPHFTLRPDPAYTDLDTKALRKQVNRLLREGNFDEAKRVLLSAWMSLGREKSYHCMTRHFIESAYRFLVFLPERVKAAKEAGLMDPTKFIAFAIEGQLDSLGLINDLDQKAYFVQRTGVPLLCEELPDLMTDLLR